MQMRALVVLGQALDVVGDHVFLVGGDDHDRDGGTGGTDDLRAGAHAAAMESRLFGVRYQIYSLPAGGLAKDEEIYRDLQELYRTMVPEPYYRGNVNFFGA